MLSFIVNPSSASGHSAHIWEYVTKKLAKEKVTYKAFLTDGPGAATRFAKEICQSEEMPTIVVIGGDGTVNEVMSGIEDFSKVIFGYIPAGSSNDFARDIGLDNNYQKSLAAILSPSEYIMLDIGKVTAGDDSRNFAVSCGMGYDASICFEALYSNIKNFLNKIKLGKLTYVVIALKQLATAPKHSCTITIDGEEVATYKNYLFAASMIHRYEGGGFMFCPEAKYDDGIIDMCVAHDLFKPKVLRILPTAYKGEHVKFKGIDSFKGKKITIKSSRPAPIHADGEPCGIHSEVNIELNAAQLKMIYC